MLQASVVPEVPSPNNRHRPLASTSTNDGTPPPVPPRTYSQRKHTNGGPALYGRHSHNHIHVPVSRPMKKYSLQEFQFLKLLGKGSFGKVRLLCLCLLGAAGQLVSVII